MSLIWHDVIILTVKSLNTRFREPLRKAIRAALGWLTSDFCGLGGGGLLTAAGGDLHINTVTISSQSSTTLNQHELKKSYTLGSVGVAALRLLLQFVCG